ncbi:MAG: hypothetical protein AAFV19_01815 [Pseudomonadota bacterium]
MPKGLGAAVVGECTITDNLSARPPIDLVPKTEVSAGPFDSPAWIVYLSCSYMPRRMRVFIDHLSLSRAS